MRSKRIVTIGVAALMLVSLCAACAVTSVTGADTTGGSLGISTHSQLNDVVGVPPGGLNSAPAVCSWGAGRLDVCALGGDGNLWHTWWDGTWHSWENLGAPQWGLTSAPTAVSWGPNRLDVFVRGASGQVKHKWYNGSWHSWEDLGMPSDSPGMEVNIHQNTAPAACSWGANRLDVIITSNGGALFQLIYNGSWQPWRYVGVPTSASIDGSPGAVATTSWGYQRMDVFVRGSDGALWQLWYKNGWQAWHRFDDTEGHIAARVINDYYFAPAVCSLGKNRLDVFFVDYNAHLQQKWYDGSWHPLYNVGGSKKLTASPSAVTWQNLGTTRIDIFSRGDDYGLWQLYYAGSTWHGWNNLGTIS